MTTKDYLNAYFETLPETTAKRTRSQLDRPELYKHEKDIGKLIGEWNTDDVLAFLSVCANGKRKLKDRTVEYIFYLLGRFYDWYIDNVEVIKNPCRDNELKGKIRKIAVEAGERAIPSKEKIEEVCAELRKDDIPKHGIYLECILRLAYDGFGEAKDIVRLKEEDIDFTNQTVMVHGIKHKLSDKTLSLLVTVHNLKSYRIRRGRVYLMSFNNGYFKFPTREKFINEIDREEDFYVNYVSRVFNRNIKPFFGDGTNQREVYMRGFYDRLQEEYGKEKLDEMIMSMYDSDSNRELFAKAFEYGMPISNTTYLKNELTRCM